MVHLVVPMPVKPPNVVDDYRYGCRTVMRQKPDGTMKCELVSLTLEQALHPQYGDTLGSNNFHDRDRIYLYCGIKAWLRHDPEALVLFDQLIIWDIPDLRDHNPDVLVAFGARNLTKYRKSFDVVKEGTRPKVLFEIVSPAYRYNDVVDKFEEYHRACVPYYVIIDREHGEGPVVLRGFRWAPHDWDELPLDSRGWLWLEPIGLWLGAEDNRVFLVNPETGEEIPDYSRLAEYAQEIQERMAEETRERQEAEARAESEARERRAAEARAESEARERRAAEARAESEARERRDAEERAKVDAHERHAAEARADAEARERREAEARAVADARERQAAEQRAMAAETRLRQMEEELRRLRGDTPPA